MPSQFKHRARITVNAFAEKILRRSMLCLLAGPATGMKRGPAPYVLNWLERSGCFFARDSGRRKLFLSAPELSERGKHESQPTANDQNAEDKQDIQE